MVRWRPLVYNKKRPWWSWKILICNRRKNWWKSTLIWRIIPMNFKYIFKNWKVNWKHFAKCLVKFLNLLTRTTNWKSLRNYFWTTPCLKYRTKHLLIRTWSGRNGGKQCRRSLKNRFKKVWKLFVQTKKLTWMNWFHTDCILKATSMIGLLVN
jgi:hypothetical protein